jgi:hypothetical protein
MSTKQSITEIVKKTILFIITGSILLVGCVSKQPSDTSMEHPKLVEGIQPIEFNHVSDDWSKGGITAMNNAIIVGSMNDMRHITINVSKTIPGKAEYLEILCQLNGFKPAWGEKVCGFKINGQNVDPLGIKTEIDSDGWHWVNLSFFSDNKLIVHISLRDFLMGEEIELNNISIYVGGNNSGTITFSEIKIVYTGAAE